MAARPPVAPQWDPMVALLRVVRREDPTAARRLVVLLQAQLARRQVSRA